MGNCLPKPRKKKRNSVKQSRSPRGEKHEDIDEILSKSSKCQKQIQNEPTDMARALKIEESDENNTAMPECQTGIKKALAFTVDMGNKSETPKIASPDAPVATENGIASTPEHEDKEPKKVSSDAQADAKKAVTFTVNIGEGEAKTKTPKQLAASSDKENGPASEIVYTNDEESLMDSIMAEMDDSNSGDTKAVDVKKSYSLDERSLMADIMREDRLKEIQEKARQEEVKRYDAKMKRLALERSKEARAESKTAGCAPGADAQRKKVRDLAAQDRRKAAERRRREELE